MKSNEAGGIVALKLVHALFRVLIRKRVIRQTDLEQIVAGLNMEAKRNAGTQKQVISELSADVMRDWLIEAGDDVKRGGQPRLEIVSSD